MTRRDMGPGPPCSRSHQAVLVSAEELPLCSQAGKGAGQLLPSLQALHEVSFKTQPHQGRVNSHHFSVFC